MGACVLSVLAYANEATLVPHRAIQNARRERLGQHGASQTEEFVSSTKEAVGSPSTHSEERSRQYVRGDGGRNDEWQRFAAYAQSCGNTIFHAQHKGDRSLEELTREYMYDTQGGSDVFRALPALLRDVVRERGDDDIAVAWRPLDRRSVPPARPQQTLFSPLSPSVPLNTGFPGAQPDSSKIPQDSDPHPIVPTQVQRREANSWISSSVQATTNVLTRLAKSSSIFAFRNVEAQATPTPTPVRISSTAPNNAEPSASPRGDESSARHAPRVPPEDSSKPTVEVPECSPKTVLRLSATRYLSYTELWETMIYFGAGMAALNVPRGALIAICEETRWEWLVSCNGAWLYDMVPVSVPVDSTCIDAVVRDTRRELHAVICHTSAVSVFMERYRAYQAAAAAVREASSGDSAYDSDENNNCAADDVRMGLVEDEAGYQGANSSDLKKKPLASTCHDRTNSNVADITRENTNTSFHHSPRRHASAPFFICMDLPPEPQNTRAEKRIDEEEDAEFTGVAAPAHSFSPTPTMMNGGLTFAWQDVVRLGASVVDPKRDYLVTAATASKNGFPRSCTHSRQSFSGSLAQSSGDESRRIPLSGRSGTDSTSPMLASASDSHVACALPRRLSVSYDPEDTALIVFTAGDPKGVELTHGNLRAAVAAYKERLLPIVEEDRQEKLDSTTQQDEYPLANKLTNRSTYLAYLPLSHIFEFLCEHVFLLNGFVLCYGSPRTLTNTSNGGTVVIVPHGDLAEYKPTVLAGVPRVLERLKRDVLCTLSEGFRRRLFLFAFAQRCNALRRGMDTPLLNSRIFKACHDLLGGRCRCVLSAASMLHPCTHLFFQVVFNVSVVQAYGLTETCGCISAQRYGDDNTESVGGLLGPVEMRLRPVDGPLPGWDGCSSPRTRTSSRGAPTRKGEVLIRGPTVMKGYYNQPELTRAVMREEGWLSTGDVVELDGEQGGGGSGSVFGLALRTDATRRPLRCIAQHNRHRRHGSGSSNGSGSGGLLVRSSAAGDSPGSASLSSILNVIATCDLDMQRFLSSVCSTSNWQLRQLGRPHSLGAMRIVGRVKNLAKNLNGEYLALERLEAVYGTNELCVPGGVCLLVHPQRSYVTALVVTNEARARRFFRTHICQHYRYHQQHQQPGNAQQSLAATSPMAPPPPSRADGRNSSAAKVSHPHPHPPPHHHNGGGLTIITANGGNTNTNHVESDMSSPDGSGGSSGGLKSACGFSSMEIRWPDVLDDPRFNATAAASLVQTARQARCRRCEFVRYVCVVYDEWSVGNGLRYPNGTLNRPLIEEHYGLYIRDLFAMEE